MHVGYFDLFFAQRRNNNEISPYYNINVNYMFRLKLKLDYLSRAFQLINVITKYEL